MIGSADGFTNLVFTNRELSICDWVFFRHFIWLLDKNKWLFWLKYFEFQTKPDFEKIKTSKFGGKNSGQQNS